MLSLDEAVEVVGGRVDSGDEIVDPVASGMSLDEASGDAGIARYEGRADLRWPGPFGYTVRVVPRHPLLATSAELGVPVQEAEDLVASVFPDQMACAENVAGDREIPDHPLTNQAIADCLHEAMDIEGLERLLARIESGDARVVARSLHFPNGIAVSELGGRMIAAESDGLTVRREHS